MLPTGIFMTDESGKVLAVGVGVEAGETLAKSLNAQQAMEDPRIQQAFVFLAQSVKNPRASVTEVAATLKQKFGLDIETAAKVAKNYLAHIAENGSFDDMDKDDKNVHKNGIAAGATFSKALDKPEPMAKSMTASGLLATLEGMAREQAKRGF